MSEPNVKRKRRPYVTYRSRVAEIHALYQRAPTDNELRALKRLPLGRPKGWPDTSPIGLEIFRLLERSEVNRDVSLLERAGHLLLQHAASGIEIPEPKRPVLPRKEPKPQVVSSNRVSIFNADHISFHESHQPSNGSQTAYYDRSLEFVGQINHDIAESLLEVVKRVGYLPSLPEPTPYPCKLVNSSSLRSTSEILQSDERFFGLPRCPCEKPPGSHQKLKCTPGPCDQ